MKFWYILFWLILFPISINAQEIALMSDIHSGIEKKLAKKNGTRVYPRKAEKLFKQKIQKIKNSNIELLIILGDSTQRKEQKRFNRLYNSLGDLNTIWIKGNHDGGYGVFSNMQLFDYGEFQIIVLDSNALFAKDTGFLSEEQKSFVLENLNKPTIIAMHHPFYTCNSSDIVSSYADFKTELEENGNVIFVLSGHCHSYNYQFSNGVKYITVEALTWANNHYVINTEDQDENSSEDPGEEPR